MKNTNFQNTDAFRSKLGLFDKRKGIFARSLTELYDDLLPLTNAGVPNLAVIKEFPFVLAKDLETGGMPEIHSTRYLKYLMGQDMLPISYTDALWMNRIGVPMQSPFSTDVEAFTMGITFGLLLPIFEEHFTKDPAQIFTALLFTCLILYPLVYKLSRYAYMRKNPEQTKFRDYSLQDLIAEGFKLFAILSTALVGIDLFNLPILKASVAAGIAPTINTLLDTLTRRPEFTWTVVLETIRSLATGAAIFAPIVYILNSVTDWCPALLPYTLAFNPAFIFTSLMTYGKLMGMVSYVLSDYCYNFRSGNFLEADYDSENQSNNEGDSLVPQFGSRSPSDAGTPLLLGQRSVTPVYPSRASSNTQQNSSFYTPARDSSEDEYIDIAP